MLVHYHAARRRPAARSWLPPPRRCPPPLPPAASPHSHLQAPSSASTSPALLRASPRPAGRQAPWTSPHGCTASARRAWRCWLTAATSSPMCALHAAGVHRLLLQLGVWGAAEPSPTAGVPQTIQPRPCAVAAAPSPRASAACPSCVLGGESAVQACSCTGPPDRALSPLLLPVGGEGGDARAVCGQVWGGCAAGGPHHHGLQSGAPGSAAWACRALRRGHAAGACVLQQARRRCSWEAGHHAAGMSPQDGPILALPPHRQPPGRPNFCMPPRPAPTLHPTCARHPPPPLFAPRRRTPPSRSLSSSLTRSRWA